MRQAVLNTLIVGLLLAFACLFNFIFSGRWLKDVKKVTGKKPSARKAFKDRKAKCQANSSPSLPNLNRKNPSVVRTCEDGNQSANNPQSNQEELKLTFKENAEESLNILNKPRHIVNPQEPHSEVEAKEDSLKEEDQKALIRSP